MQYVTVASGKGGVTKTTTAVNLARGLAEVGHRTLLVDFDPLGQCATGLGFDPEPGVYDLLVRLVALRRLAKNTKTPHLYLLPGNSETKVTELILAMRGEQAVNLAMDFRSQIPQESFDYVVIDTAPSGLLQELALLLADVTLVPVTLDYLGSQGAATVVKLRQTLGAISPEVFLVPSMYDKRLRRHRETLAELRDFALQEGLKLAKVVPLRDEMREIWASGTTVFDHRARSGHKEGLAQLRASYIDLVARVTAEEVIYAEPV